MTTLKLHLIVLPRWFGLPAALAAVALGAVLAGAAWWLMLLALVSGATMMAWAHVMNTYLDHEWTGFDRGDELDRSKPKAYTTGQQPIAAGLATPAAVLGSALFWLLLSAAAAVPIALYGTWWVWLPWGLATACTFWYSWGKQHYMCEAALGLGFGSFAVMFGAATSPDGLGLFGVAFLAGLPFTVLWGFAAETVDQAQDAAPNWPRGLRNLGALVWHNQMSVTQFTAFLFVCAYLVQLFLIAGDVLSPWTGLSLVALPLLAYGLAIMGPSFKKAGILLLLAGIFLHMLAFTVGQAVG